MTILDCLPTDGCSTAASEQEEVASDIQTSVQFWDKYDLEILQMKEAAKRK